MAAYAAVISLKHTINGLRHYSYRITFSTLEMLEVAYNQSTDLQQVLERLEDSSTSRKKRVDVVDGKIRDVAHKLEDVLEFHQLKSQKEKKYEDEEVRKEITSFLEAVKKMEKEYIEELSSPLTEEDDEDDDDAAIVDFGVGMVGQSSLFNTILNKLLSRMSPIDSYFYSFLGENGSGRTAFANAMFEGVRQYYDCSAWVTIGTHEQLKEVVIRILEQVDNNEVAALLLESGEEDEKMICKELYKALEHRRYMIALDDVRSVHVLDCLRSSFPADQSNGGSLVLLTTNQEEIVVLEFLTL